MQTILDFLGTDHRACDDLFAAAEMAVSKKNWTDADDLLERFLTAMARHLSMEETVLFPAFETRMGGSGMGPTQVMRMEHEQMRALFQDMKQALADANLDRFLGLSETLNVLMQQHNLKEENVLYPMTDQMLDAERNELIRAMQAVA